MTTVIAEKKVSLLPVVMFIAGNTVGAGILALPIMLGLAGFLPSLIAMFFTWMMMLFSGIVMAKQNLLHKDNVDLPTFYENVFGKIGKFIVILCYLFLFFGLSVAYLSGATSTIINLVPFNLSYYPVLFSVFAILAFIIIRGMKTVLKGNSLMMFILFFAFILLIVKAFSGLDPIKLNYTDWKFLPATFPVLLCSFGFHNTIPLAAKTLKGDVKRINLALFLGSLIPLILNMIILVAVAGVLHPSIGGKTSLISAFKSSLPATVPLSIKFNSSFFTIFGLIFSILAIFTSYLAVGAGLLGFTKDCLSKWKNNFKYSEHLITFGIPLIITIFAQNIFLKAINFAAGIGAVIIFGIMPCILATKKYKSKLKIISIIFLLLFICMFLIELGQQLNLFKILPKFF